jgi:AAA+ ATPase superfamily predicted ATPase
MDFINRESELQLLDEVAKRSLQSAQMTIIIGRRRIGKTSLALKSAENQLLLYFFVARKNEALLCRDFMDEIERKLKLPALGEYTSFIRIFEFLLVAAQSRPFTLILDEFQEFLHINPAIFGEMQNQWDRYKSSAKMNLIISGSIFSLMKKIFENSREPLFGRANERIWLKPFNVHVIKELVTGYAPEIKNEHLLAFYTITGGVARYVEHFADRKKFTLDQLLNEIFRENSLLLDEGMNMLIEEFGRDYTTYFSILSLIASSKTSRSELESILMKNIGGYLERLENDYRIIRKVKPILAKPGGKTQKYFIDDNFLGFWFRFVYKNRAALETGNYAFARSVAARDFESFSGQYLEKYFREKLALTGKYSIIGRYWEKGNQNEIDIVAVDDAGKGLFLAEVKRNKLKINPEILLLKSARILPAFHGYSVTYAHLSLEDM